MTETVPTLPLWGALAAARAEITPIERDGLSEGGAYTFASAQAVLALATPLLARHGLMLIPSGEDGLIAGTNLRRELALVHVSGAQHTINVSLPIVTLEHRGGREVPVALDKAVLTARTAALRAALRDLLGIPAVERAEDPEHRGDANTAPPAARPPKPARPTRPAPRSDEPPPDDVPPVGDAKPPRERSSDPRRVKTLASLRAALKTLGQATFERIAERAAAQLADTTTPELLKILARMKPALEQAEAEAEARRVAREAEEEARAAKALQDAAELGEGKRSPVEPEPQGGAADDFEARAAALATVARVRATLVGEGGAS